MAGRNGLQSALSALLVPVVLLGLVVAAGVLFVAVPVGAADPIPCPAPNDEPDEDPPPPDCTRRCCPEGGSGSPVLLAQREYHTTRADLVVPGPGLSLSFQRFYRSGSFRPGLLGYGWSCNFDAALAYWDTAEGRIVYLQLPTNEMTSFYEDPPGSGVYVNQDDRQGWTLRYIAASGLWEAGVETGMVYRFDNQGRWVSQSDSEGNGLSLDYGTAGQVTVADTNPGHPRQLVLYLDPNGFLSLVSDGVRLVSFEYDPASVTKRLLRASEPYFAGESPWKESYSYAVVAGGDPCFAPVLLASAYLTSPEGNDFPPLLEITYDSGQKVVDVTVGGRKESYGPGGLPNRRTKRVSGVASDTYVYVVDANGMVQEIYKTSVAASNLLERRVYDGFNNVIFTWQVGERSGEGVWTHSIYDQEGNVTALIRDYAQSGDANAPGYYPSMAGHENAMWRYKYARIQGAPRVTDTTGPAFYGDTHLVYYGQGEVGGPEGYLKETWRVLSRDGQTGEPVSYDVLVRYTYETTASSPAFGQVKSVTGGQGTTTYTYDSKGALETTTPPDSNLTRLVTAYVTDALYQVTSVTDPSGAITAMGYDALGRTTSVTPPDPGNGTTGFGTAFGYGVYVAAGGEGLSINWDFKFGADPLVKSTVQDPNGRNTSRYSDPDGRVWAVKDAAGNVTKYDYFKGGL